MARRTMDEAIWGHRLLSELELSHVDPSGLSRAASALSHVDPLGLSRAASALSHVDPSGLSRAASALSHADLSGSSRTVALELGHAAALELSRADIREEQRTLASLHTPTVEETLRLSKTAAEEIGAGLGSIASIHQEELQRLAEGISTPWVDKSNALSSFESVALLSSVGGILHGDPFDSVTSEALRSHLGDWSQTSLPQSIFSDYRARESFFRDHGFDHRLTIIPEPAFTDLLDETGISHPALFPQVPLPAEEPESKEPENDEHLARQRNLDAYDTLFSLETQLRDYIHEVMTDCYGPKWEKQQVSYELRQAWEKKRATAIEKGEEERPLLWYADFTDYVAIICQRNNWSGIFQPVFRNEIDIRASFQRLHPIRIPVMHARVITKDDILLLTVESRRILKAIGKLEDD